MNQAFRLPEPLTFKPADFADGARLVPQVETKFRVMPPSIEEFDHFRPAEHLYSLTKTEGLAGFGAALSNMEKLIAAINALL